MADVTVGKLAETVGIPIDRLLQQMAEAGLSQKNATDAVSNDEKQTLLAFLKSSHGDTAGEARKITLKRKTISTLKAPTAAGKKTVNVEVRQKRTYVKRDEADLKAQQELEEQRRKEEEDAAIAELANTGDNTTSTPGSMVDDVELRRQAAAHARKSEEEKQKQERQELQERKAAAAKKDVRGATPAKVTETKKFGAPAKPIGKRGTTADEDEDEVLGEDEEEM